MEYKSKEIETDRLLLRKGLEQDYLDVYEYDFRKLRDIDNEFKYEKQDLNKIRKWFDCGIDRFHSQNEKEKVFDWIIYLKENGKPIGNIFTHNQKDFDSLTTEIGFNLHPNYWGNHYMMEAANSVIDYLFETGYNKIICGYSEGNIKSKKVVERLGFEPYRIRKFAWMKNGTPIDDHDLIMTKENYDEIRKKK